MSKVNAQYSGFLNFKGWIPLKDGTIYSDIRLNPLSISSYYGGKMDVDDKINPPIQKDVTIVWCGVVYYIDMPLEEFDEFIDTVERGLSFDEPL